MRLHLTKSISSSLYNNTMHFERATDSLWRVRLFLSEDGAMGMVTHAHSVARAPSPVPLAGILVTHTERRMHVSETQPHRLCNPHMYLCLCALKEYLFVRVYPAFRLFLFELFCRLTAIVH